MWVKVFRTSDGRLVRGDQLHELGLVETTTGEILERPTRCPRCGGPEITVLEEQLADDARVELQRWACGDCETRWAVLPHP